MADEIKIKVSVEDAQLKALINKLNEGEGNLNDLTMAKKELNKIFKETELGTPKFNEYAGALAVINDRQRDVRIQTRAGHEAYFKAGLEVRQLALSTGIFKGALGGMTGEMANSVLNAVQLKQALVPLGISMTGVGVGVAAAVAVLPSLINLLLQTEKRAKSAKESMEVFKEEMTAFFENVSPEEARRASRLTEADLNVAKTELVIAKEKMNTLAFAAAHFQKLNEFAEAKSVVNALEAQIVRYNETLAIQRNLVAMAERRAAAEGRVVTGVKAERESTEKQDEAMKDAAEKRAEGKRLAAKMKEKVKSGEFRREAIREATSEMDEGLDEGGQKAKQLGSILQSGAESFTSTLISGLLTGQDIAQQLVAVLLNIGISLFTKSIGFAHGGMIPEPVIGRGIRTGTTYTFAERGPEYVTPANRSYGNNSMTPMIKVIPILTNQGLAVRVEVGDRVNNRARIG